MSSDSVFLSVDGLFECCILGLDACYFTSVRRSPSLLLGTRLKNAFAPRLAWSVKPVFSLSVHLSRIQLFIVSILSSVRSFCSVQDMIHLFKPILYWSLYRYWIRMMRKLGLYWLGSIFKEGLDPDKSHILWRIVYVFQERTCCFRSNCCLKTAQVAH